MDRTVFDVRLSEVKNMVFKFDYLNMNKFDYFPCSKNDVRIHLIFNENVFDPTLKTFMKLLFEIIRKRNSSNRKNVFGRQ